MRSSLGDKCPNFLDTKLPSFEPLHNAMDNVFRQLRADGVGAESKATEVFSKEEEDLLWSSGTLSTDSPKGLFNAVFFLNGKSFCLRGGDEHRNLKLSQFTREANRYKYVESASKNRAGGLGQLRVKKQNCLYWYGTWGRNSLSCLCARHVFLKTSTGSFWTRWLLCKTCWKISIVSTLVYFCCCRKKRVTDNGQKYVYSGRYYWS